MGFGAEGILTGSVAAGMMSETVIVTGGSIATGSTVATYQSIGAVGLGASAGPIGIIAAVGGGLLVFRTLHSCQNKKPTRND